jgi:hypothetical protein
MRGTRMLWLTASVLTCAVVSAKAGLDANKASARQASKLGNGAARALTKGANSYRAWGH